MGQDRSNLCGIGGTGSARGADVNSSFQANQNEVNFKSFLTEI